MNNLLELETSITDAILKIGDGKTTPKKCGIGRMLTQLSSVCHDTYTRLLAEYKPVAQEFFSGNKPKENKIILSAIEKQLIAIEKNISFDIDDFDDFGELLPDVFDKAIEDASARIEGKKKKKIIATPDPSGPTVRNRQVYLFNDQIYGKGPLVLAVLKFYINANPDIDYVKLKNIFPDSLLKSYGIFKKLDAAQEASKKRKRYFLKDDQIITIADCQIAVCNQFTSENISGFFDKAIKIGYDIKIENE